MFWAARKRGFLSLPEAQVISFQSNRVGWGMGDPDRDDSGNSEHDYFKAYLIHRLLLTCRSTRIPTSIDLLHVLTQRTQFFSVILNYSCSISNLEISKSFSSCDPGNACSCVHTSFGGAGCVFFL